MTSIMCIRAVLISAVFAVSKAVQAGAVGAMGDLQPTCATGELFWSHYLMNLYVVQYCTSSAKLYADKE